jgi:hypothetical protein
MATTERNIRPAPDDQAPALREILNDAFDGGLPMVGFQKQHAHRGNRLRDVAVAEYVPAAVPRVE